jgi:hypothetical protein
MLQKFEEKAPCFSAGMSPPAPLLNIFYALIVYFEKWHSVLMRIRGGLSAL